MTKNFQELDSVTTDNLETSQESDNFLSGNLNLKPQLSSRIILGKALNRASEGYAKQVDRTQKMLIERANPPAPEKIPFIETFGANLLDTPVANYAARLLNGEYLVDKENPNYSAYSEIKGTEYEQHWEDFLIANGPEDTSRIKRKIDRENAVRDTMASSSIGANLLAGVLTLPLDPVNLIPIGGTAYRATKAGKFFAGAGKTAAAGFLSTSVSEAALQADQITRTTEESVTNIAASTVLSGILGGAASLLSKEKFNKLALETQKNIQDEGPVFGFNEKGDLLQGERDRDIGQSSVGAMAAPIPRSQRTTAQDEALYAGPKRIAGAVASLSRKLSPIQEVLNTKGVVGKRALQGIVRINMFSNKNIEGGVANAASTENALKLYDAGLAYALRDGRANYKKFSDNLLEQQGKNKFTAPFNIKATVLRHEEFNSKVYDALISGDVHEIPEVEATAKSYRKNVFEPIREQGIEAGIFGEDVSIGNATSYLMIQYDRNKIVAQEPEFRKFLAKQVSENLIPQIQKEHADRRASLTAKSQDLFNRIKVLEKESKTNSEKLFSDASGDAPLSDEDLVKILDSYKTAAKDLSETPKPKTLIEFIRSRGGVFDKSGRVKALFSARNRKPNGITAKEKLTDIDGEKVNSDMKSIKDQAWREGYFPEHATPPETKDFLAALEDELDRVDIRYTADGLNNADKIQQTKEFLNQIKGFGINIGKIKDAKMLREIEIGGKTFKDILLKKEISVLKKRLAEIDEKIGSRYNPNDYDSEWAINFTEEVTNELVRKLRNLDHQGVIMPYDMKIGVRGPAKERSLNFIKHSDLKPWTVQNIEKLARDYTRILGTDIELSKKFGDLNLEKVQAEISDEYDVLRAKSPTEKDRLSLDKEEREVKQTLMDLKNIVRGNYGRVDRPDSFWPTMARTSRNVAYLQKMGSVVYASLVDPVHLVFRHGLGRFLNTGLKPLIFNLKGFKLASKDTAFIGQAFEADLHSRASNWSDMGNPYSSKSKLENLSISLVGIMSKLNLLSVWTDSTKRVSSVMSQQRISEEVVKLSKLYEGQHFELGQGLKDVDLSKSPITKKSRAYLALLGIDEKNVREIVGQLKTHSTKEKGLTILNLEKWTDRSAVEAMANALNLDIDSSIITRGVGELPTLLHTEVGKTLFQFKSFLLAANQQVLIRGLQQADAAVLQGVISMVTMGMVVYFLQKKTKGEEVSDDPNVWLYEGLDRSGLLPIIMEVNGYADLMGVGVGNALELREPSLTPGSAVISRAGGPTVSMAKDLGDLGASTVRKIKGEGDYTEADQRKAIKMLPYNNLFYLRGLFSLLDDSEQSE